MRLIVNNGTVYCATCRNEATRAHGTAGDDEGVIWFWWMCRHCGRSTRALPLPRKDDQWAVTPT